MKKSLGEQALRLPNLIMPGRDIRHDISYGEYPLMTYDEFPLVNVDAPLVLFWYGGSWKTGNKQMYRFVGHVLQKMGAHAFLIDYPKYPEQKFPGFIQDAEAALNQIRNRYPNRKVYLMGHSAGGNTAMILGMTTRQAVDGIISIAGACTLPERIWYPVFGEAVRNGKSDPRSYVEKIQAQTKFFFVHGILDTIVLKRDSITMHNKLISAGIASKLYLISGVEHIGILPLLMFGPLFRTREKLKEFILR